jgi:16S rRNA (adenine1518-N6/adenine1519-N6)-dimethyltransferase
MRRATDLVTRLQARQPNDKNLGQHFLIEEAHLEAIVGLAGDLEGRIVLEIGPGPGTLTEHLLHSGATVHAIEIDSVAVEHLREAFAEAIASQALVLHEGDALSTPWPDRIDAVVSNIPYQISSPLIDVLEKHRRRHSAPDVVVLLVQEEFAERLTLATPADRGSLGVCTALGWSSTMDRRVPPGSFRPPPAVMSRVCVLRPVDLPDGVDHRLVRQTVHAAFHHRRRKLRTSLQRPPRRLSRLPGWHATRWKHAVASLGDDAVLDLRPEDLTVEEWCDFCQRLSSVEVQNL